MVEERRSQQAATGFAYYLGSNTANRYEDGYLVRDFPIKSLYVEEATPPVDELQTFNAVGLLRLTVSMHGLCLPDPRRGLYMITFYVVLNASKVAKWQQGLYAVFMHGKPRAPAIFGWGTLPVRQSFL